MTEEELLKLLLCAKANQSENEIIYELINTKDLSSKVSQELIDKLETISHKQKKIIFKIGAL